MKNLLVDPKVRIGKKKKAWGILLCYKESALGKKQTKQKKNGAYSKGIGADLKDHLTAKTGST